jgi:dTDP-4-dehydrorhamnose reductase
MTAALPITRGTRVYVAGCAGMLGTALYAALQRRGATVKATDVDLNEPWLEHADVCDLHGLRRSIESFAPDVLMNLAAMTDLEGCEREPERAWLVNAGGAENAAFVASTLGVPFVQISTAGIFDGAQETYHDYDKPNPLTVYGKSKLYAEEFACARVERHYVLRAGWMMGGGPRKDKKFVNKIFRQILAGARVLQVVDDKLGTPTYTVDFAEGLCHVASSGMYGVYNQVGEGRASRLDVAREFVRALGLADEIEIRVVPSAHFDAEYFAPRPASEQLVNLKLTQRGLNRMRDWKVCLAEYSGQYREALKAG